MQFNRGGSCEPISMLFPETGHGSTLSSKIAILLPGQCVIPDGNCLLTEMELAEQLLLKAEGAILLRRQLQETSNHTLAFLEATAQRQLPQPEESPQPDDTPALQTLISGARSRQEPASGAGGDRREVQAEGIRREEGASSSVLGSQDRGVNRGLSFPDMPWDADLSEMDKVRFSG